MQVSKWGNSLAVRLPAAIVQELELKAGDNIDLEIYGRREFGIRKDFSRSLALETLRQLRRPFPPDYKFDRDEANER
jgi:antitoxin MazE